jgi:diguanylate cyclase (GGDEF)-like protein
MLFPLGNMAGNVWRACCRETLRGVSVTMASENARNGLEISRSEFVLDSTTDSVLVVDSDWRILYRNRQALDLLKGRELGLGMNLWEAFPEALGGPFHKKYAWAFENQEPVTFEEHLESMGIWFEVHVYPSPNAISMFFRDVTERVRIREQLTYLACHDPLTGLFNRTQFHSALDHALARSGGKELALLYLDLDHFKEVNDSHGHPFGDTLLKQVTERIRGFAEDDDILARLGGDEFVLVTGRATSTESLCRLTEGLIDAIGMPFSIEGCQIEIGASIGIAIAPHGGTATDDLLRSADTALYAAKRSGGGHCFFAPMMAEEVRLRQELRRDLASALDREQLRLVYQPIYSVDAGDLVRFEALLRWQHPQRGPVPPAEFIPLAEETGLIAAIGDWVLQQACAEASAWPKDIGLAINLSPAQFRPQLPFRVAEVLHKSGVRPDRLVLEITETVIFQSSVENLRLLEQLRTLGVKIALDDFGTGYASLGYLKEFPFHEIKIDRSFVSDDSAEAFAIVDSVTKLAHALGARVTAEGVETAEQMERIRTVGCDKAQGYLLGRPAETSEIRKYMSAETAAAPTAPAPAAMSVAS